MLHVCGARARDVGSRSQVPDLTLRLRFRFRSGAPSDVRPQMAPKIKTLALIRLLPRIELRAEQGTKHYVSKLLLRRPLDGVRTSGTSGTTDDQPDETLYLGPRMKEYANTIQLKYQVVSNLSLWMLISIEHDPTLPLRHT